MLRGEATNTNFIVIGLTQPGLEPMINRTRDKHANHYATDAVLICTSYLRKLHILFSKMDQNSENSDFESLHRIFILHSIFMCFFFPLDCVDAFQ